MMTIPSPSAGPDPAPRRPGARPLRWAVSLWLVFHVSAIIIAPASVAPSSDLVRSAWAVFRPYLQILYLNHGYHFFAPEPDREHAAGLRGRARRRDGRPRPNPRPRHPAPPALPPPFHAHRAHGPGAAEDSRRSGTGRTPSTSAASTARPGSA